MNYKKVSIPLWKGLEHLDVKAEKASTPPVSDTLGIAPRSVTNSDHQRHFEVTENGEFAGSPAASDSTSLGSALNAWKQAVASNVKSGSSWGAFGSQGFKKSSTGPGNGSLSIKDLVRLLSQGSEDERREAAEFIRHLCREDVKARAEVVNAGGLHILAELSRSQDAVTVECAVTSLHNLALTKDLQPLLVIPEVVESLIYVLENGTQTCKANAAASVFYLTRDPKQAEFIAKYTRIYQPLVRLIQSNDLRGQKDAAYAMCHLTLIEMGRKEFVKAGVVEAFLEILEREGAEEMEEKITAVISNLAKSALGREALVANNFIDTLGDLLESKKPRAREDATSTLYLLATHSTSACELVMKAGILPDLVAVSKSDQISVRGQSKAKQLVQLLRTKAKDMRVQQVSQVEEFNVPASGYFAR